MGKKVPPIANTEVAPGTLGIRYKGIGYKDATRQGVRYA